MLRVDNFRAQVTDIGPVQTNNDDKRYRFIYLVARSGNPKHKEDALKLHVNENKFQSLDKIKIGDTVEIEMSITGKTSYKGDGQEEYYKVGTMLHSIRKYDGNSRQEKPNFDRPPKYSVTSNHAIRH